MASARLAWCPSHRTRTCIALYTVKSSTNFRAWQCSESLWSLNLRYLSQQHTSINCRSLLGYLESYRLLLAVIFPQLESKRHFLALLCSAAASLCTSVPALISHRWLSSPFFEAWLCRHPAMAPWSQNGLWRQKSVHLFISMKGKVHKCRNFCYDFKKGLRNSSETFPLYGATLWKSHLEIVSYICLIR